MAPRGRECPSCGGPLECGAEDGACWCSAVAVPGAALADLRERFDGCLCPDCLRAAARRFAVHTATYSPPRNVGP